MTSNPAQLKESVPTNAGLVGSFYSGKRHEEGATQLLCVTCKAAMLPDSKFCGDCGSAAQSQVQETAHAINNDLMHAQSIHTMPAFAQVSPKLRKAVPPQLKQEYRKLNTLLLRERIFLFSHYVIFLSANLFGFWTSFKAYHELFYADEISRSVMALFPLFFINCVALGCLVPIKGTKSEIARLKEKITYLHYQIEYANI